MKSRTKIKMIRLPIPFSDESQDDMTWNIWKIGDVGYIEGITQLTEFQVILVIVLGNKIIYSFLDAVEVIED
jgi:hypothetical protein